MQAIDSQENSTVNFLYDYIQKYKKLISISCASLLFLFIIIGLYQSYTKKSSFAAYEKSTSSLKQAIITFQTENALNQFQQLSRYPSISQMHASQVSQQLLNNGKTLQARDIFNTISPRLLDKAYTPYKNLSLYSLEQITTLQESTSTSPIFQFTSLIIKPKISPTEIQKVVDQRPKLSSLIKENYFELEDYLSLIQ